MVFSCIGVTYAQWTDGLQFMGKMEMGNIEPQLVSIDVISWNTTYFYGESIIPEPSISITTDFANNSAHLNISDAHQGLIYKVFYTVHNYGTIPIISKIPENSFSGFLVDYEPIRVESDSTGTGEMTITVINEGDINFAIPLTFIQAVGI